MVEAKSRAVLRLIDPGNWARCEQCGERLKYKAGERTRSRQVICNVYEEGVWKRTEHFGQSCYADAGEPYGPPDDRKLTR